MSEFAPAEIRAMPLPDAMPVLKRGRHKNQSRGACFMEYTALLAGEPFTDEPLCVDGELAAVLRGANDILSDVDRPLLVPLLGRAIGLAVDSPPPRTTGYRRIAIRRRREVIASHRERTARLRREVTRMFVAALQLLPRRATRAWSGHSGELHWVFWQTMTEPAMLSTSPDYVRRLIHRLHVLHECYEQAMGDLGFTRTASIGSVPADQGSVAGPDTDGPPRSTQHRITRGRRASLSAAEVGDQPDSGSAEWGVRAPCNT